MKILEGLLYASGGAMGATSAMATAHEINWSTPIFWAVTWLTLTAVGFVVAALQDKKEQRA